MTSARKSPKCLSVACAKVTASVSMVALPTPWTGEESRKTGGGEGTCTKDEDGLCDLHLSRETDQLIWCFLFLYEDGLDQDARLAKASHATKKASDSSSV